MARSQYRWFGVDVSDDLPDVDGIDLEIIGEEIIQRIIERTLTGQDKNNNTFPGYSKKSDYAKKHGKRNPPDLNLTGEMLSELQVLQVKPRLKHVIIGYPTGDDELLGKVEGNIRGSYGRKPNQDLARDFLGISDGDLDDIISEFI